MGYVTITIDLDEIDSDDLIEEICNRRLSKKQIKQLSDEFNVEIPINNLKTSNLADKMKYEYLMKIFDKYNLSDIEKLLPE